MNKKEYNGWYNYETWLVNLWMDNEQGSQQYFAELAEEAWLTAEAGNIMTKAQMAACNLEYQLKEYHEETLPELKGFAADMMNAAMSEVNWLEIAQHLIDDVDKEEAA